MKCDQRIPIFRRGYRLQWEEMQNCHVILYPEGMAKLNDSATMILELVDGQRSLADIARTLNVRFPDAGGVDDDVTDFFAAAREQKWIIFREPS
ncbi:pyrroloquinoline quinone biosynthesis peptide chaperone PqqD [Erwinia amylovora]|uniref:PqqA binding protein n=4 Tax=Erwinia amylovora TaxID=552 RepID=A0A831A642_ERWAM|nr:pyrroloquinoline quinone biosynthesis peptide chaperone PqqD [Erwinia amylovora]EKV52523.1 Coenzyme PQQ synthesis protein D [Erwinia amylovora ACW56400]CBA22990.1 Coenzyme PQQ synthesis protein D [Erwinia amylovora CFBP1430]CBJ45190.1 coenzyme PQQ synthesis protein D [Erwinia amylovora ATCC 49946]CCO79950.1 Coenzyme PQQ synthesis protein D [Erwinia amylovora Ea356]CCO83755.1 Coenzyme PQQ synthesis protein D [Erwinia amylovora Ea266]CCO87516.1 Coenzyme PQQ synthesis protein D [Erwinia amylo